MEDDQQPTVIRPSGTPEVTISQTEYESLRQQAGQAAGPIPAVPNVAPITASAYPPEAGKSTSSEKVWFMLAVGILVSMFFNGGTLFFLPIILFAALAGKGFMKDASEHSKPAKGAFLVFKVIAIIGIGAFIVVYGFALLLLAALFFGGGHMG